MGFATELAVNAGIPLMASTRLEVSGGAAWGECRQKTGSMSSTGTRSRSWASELDGSRRGRNSRPLHCRRTGHMKTVGVGRLGVEDVLVVPPAARLVDRLRSRVSRPQDGGQRLAVPALAVVGPGGHRVERLLPGRGGLLLLRVRDHDRRVQIQGPQPAVPARSPAQASCSARGRSPPGRGTFGTPPGRRDRIRQTRLLPQDSRRQAVAAERDRGAGQGHFFIRTTRPAG